jgi:Zn-dependent M28 family amino/carboxypeptidase
MKLVPCIYVLLMPLAACGPGGERVREFSGDTALAYIQAQVAFGPRVPNTEGHRRAGDWLAAQLATRADTVVIQSFTHVTTGGETLELRNFVGRFRPEASERVLYLAHWDTRPVADKEANLANQRRPIDGANDGGSGVAVLLGVADALKKVPPGVGVDLLFVDAEDYGDWTAKKDVLVGSRFYAKNPLPGPKPLFAVVWDMVGDKDLRLYKEGHSVTNAPEVVDRVWKVAAELGYDDVFRDQVGQTIEDDHVPLLEAGIRAIDVIDLDYDAWHTLGDTMGKVSARSLQVVGDVAMALLR